ncbi:hypothetical protein [uncultured Methylobacterium sp.]|jgi:hypothetical protein|uniref:hypothetical protein n=1 Tax=uncultured Methylobacterium sp. TaxID=157278 RepID=UPI00260EDC81|nr:hypothetical protein [uncultured Methylobacterium sp.]
MKRLMILILLAVPIPAAAQSYDDTRAINAMRDAARAHERQAESLRQIERIERDRALRDDRDRRNAERDSRSQRRFDR